MTQEVTGSIAEDATKAHVLPTEIATANGAALDGAALDGARADGISVNTGDAADAVTPCTTSEEKDISASRQPMSERSPAVVKSLTSSSPTALQDTFLNGLRRENVDAVIYLCDGSQERGVVRAFDTFTVLLENRNSGKMQLIYKHSIARIFPVRMPSLLLERPPKNRNAKNSKNS